MRNGFLPEELRSRDGVTMPALTKADLERLRKESEANTEPVTPDEQEKCYGTRRICPRSAHCNLAEPCRSRSNEEASDIYYNKLNVYVPCIEYETEGKRTNGRRGLKDNDETVNDYMLHLEAEAPSQEQEDETLDIGGIEIQASSYNDVKAVTEHICDLALNAPTAFKCLLKKIYGGKRQIGVASEMGISRQAVNKRLLKELGIDQKRKTKADTREAELLAVKEELETVKGILATQHDAYASLSIRDFTIFKMLRSENMRVKPLAFLLSCSERSIYEAVASIRKMLGKDALPARICGNDRKPKKPQPDGGPKE